MTGIVQDLRFALRTMKKNPGVAAIAIVTLALGIGATTIIFSAIDSILLEPFTFKNSDRLATIFIHDVTHPDQNGNRFYPMPELMDFREQNKVFEDMVGISPLDVLYFDGKETQQFDGGWVTPNTFEFMGVPPLLGRWITADDAKPNAPPVFAITDRLWAKAFNRDPSILGTTMTLNGEKRTLVAIMPPRFLFLSRDVYMPVPWSHNDVLNKKGSFPQYFEAVGRLRPGLGLQAANADFDVIIRPLSKIYQKDYPPKFTVQVMSFVDTATPAPFRHMLYTLMIAVSLLMLIACCNVANLLLARATAREKEIAIRASLGANRGRLVGQLLVESLILSAGAAFWVAAWLTPVLCGLAPAIHIMRGELHAKLAGSGKGSGTGMSHGRLRSSLVVFEVALSVVLLAGAGLMMRSLVALTHVDLGFDPANMLWARVVYPEARSGGLQQKKLFFQQLLQRITASPGVIAASESINIPPFGGIYGEVTIPGKTHSERWNSSLQLISEGYFKTVGFQVLRGRLLSQDDVDSARRVAVINQSMAQKYFDREDPIGQTIKFNFLDRIPDAPHDAYYEIIGIVQDIKNRGLRDSPNPDAYVPYTISGAGTRGILLRTAGEPLSMLPTLRREIAAIDPEVPLNSNSTGSIEGYMKEYLYSGPQFGFITMAAFAGVGLVLVTIGVFSVMAYSVSLQTHDIGVRMTLGARQSDVLRMVIGKGLALLAAGVGLGLLAGLALARLLASQLWGVPPNDPATFGAVVVIIFLVGLAACFSPAQRATKVDAMVALRYE